MLSSRWRALWRALCHDLRHSLRHSLRHGLRHGQLLLLAEQCGRVEEWREGLDLLPAHDLPLADESPLVTHAPRESSHVVDGGADGALKRDLDLAVGGDAPHPAWAGRATDAHEHRLTTAQLRGFLRPATRALAATLGATLGASGGLVAPAALGGGPRRGLGLRRVGRRDHAAHQLR